jgi:hypothetical protein
MDRLMVSLTRAAACRTCPPASPGSSRRSLLFVRQFRRHAQTLLVGTSLCPDGHTGASVLPLTGRARDRHFMNTHQVFKPQPTFSDALAVVRHAISSEEGLSTSGRKRERNKP